MKAGIGDWTVTCADVHGIHVKNDGHRCLRPVVVCPFCNRLRAATAAVALADHEKECLFRQDAAPHPNQHTPPALRKPKRRGKLVSLTEDERATLVAGAAALGETPTDTLRRGGLERAANAIVDAEWP